MASGGTLVGSTSLNLARALVLMIGGAALLISITGLLNGEELTDPVFPAGLELPLRLTRERRFDNGMVQLSYERAD